MDCYCPCWTCGHTEAWGQGGVQASHGSADSRGSSSISRHPLSTGSSPPVSGGPLRPGPFSQEEAGNHPGAPALPPQLPLPFPPPAFHKARRQVLTLQKPSTAFLGGAGEGREVRADGSQCHHCPMAGLRAVGS